MEQGIFVVFLLEDSSQCSENNFLANTFCEVCEEMARTREEWEEILPLSESELIALNTRISRSVSVAINHATGILQTASPRLKVTKQYTVQVLLERGLESLFEDFERQDHTTCEDSEKIVSIARKPSGSFLVDAVIKGDFR